MKKVILLVAAAAAGVFLWRRLEEERTGRELWQEVTDPLPNQGRA